MWVPWLQKPVHQGLGVAHTEQNCFGVHHAVLALPSPTRLPSLINAELYDTPKPLPPSGTPAFWATCTTPSTSRSSPPA
jgi:hypothetical protein